MKKILFTSAFFATILFACKTKEKTVATTPVKKGPDCFVTNYTYEGVIKPIMDQNCGGCHNENMKAGYNFNRLEFVKKAAENGYLLGTIKHLDGYDPMPAHAEKLDQATIDKIECWINTGMK